MPAIFGLQYLVLASLSRASPAPTTLNLMARRLFIIPLLVSLFRDGSCNANRPELF
jgi:hypothetical protein